MGLYDGATAVVPCDEPLLEPWLREGAEGGARSAPAATSPRGQLAARRPVPDACSQHVVLRTASRSSSSCPSTRPTSDEHAGGGRRGAGGRGDAGGRLDVRFSGLRGEHVLLGRAPRSSTTATTPTRCPCAPPSTTSRHTRPQAGALAVLGDMLELGPAEDEHHRDIGAYAATAGVDVLVDRRPARREDARRLRRRGLRRRPTRGRPPRWRATCSRPATWCWSRARAASASRSSRRRWRRQGLMGEVLIAGTASLLICIFLSPSSSRSCGGASSASRSARRARRSTTPRPARRRWAGSSSSPRSRCRSCC